MHLDRRALALGISLCALAAQPARAADGALAWDKTFDQASAPDDAAKDLAITPEGDLVSVGRFGGRFAALKQSGASGDKLWSSQLTGRGLSGGLATAVVVDASGDIYASGYVTNGTAGTDFAVVRFNGADGSVVWSRLIDGGLNQEDFARNLVLDADGDVLAVGVLTRPTTLRDFAVVKLDGATGTIAWQTLLRGVSGSSGEDGGHGIAVNAAGNPFVAGWVQAQSGSFKMDFAAYKLFGSNGGIQWARRYTPAIQNNAHANSVAIDGSGNAFVGGSFDSKFTVMKLAGNSGTKLWQYQYPVASSSPPSSVYDVQVTPNGILAAGITGSSGTSHALLARLSASTGAQQWAEYLAPVTSSSSGPFAVPNASGDVLATGSTPSGYITRRHASGGAKLWSFHPSPLTKRPFAIALSGSSLFIAGSAVSSGSATDLWSARYDLVDDCVNPITGGLIPECAICQCGVFQRCVNGVCQTYFPPGPL